LTSIKNIHVLREIINNEKLHEPHLEAPPDHPFQFIEEIRQPWTKSDGGKIVELETKEIPPRPSSNPLCIQEFDREDMYGMEKEDTHSG
jgi:hypothetical protein